jgi:hypothetical protein
LYISLRKIAGKNLYFGGIGMNNNFINDNRLYMVFTDNNNKKHKAYHVVNGELVKTPEYEAHLAKYEAKQNADKKLAKIEKKITKIAAIALASLLIISAAVKITMNIKEEKEAALIAEQEAKIAEEYAKIHVPANVGTLLEGYKEIEIHYSNKYEEEKTTAEGKPYTEITYVTTDGKIYRSSFWKKAPCGHWTGWMHKCKPYYYCVYEEVK